MAVSLSLTHFLSFPSRNQLNSPVHPSLNLVQLQDLRLRNKWCVNVSRKKKSEASAQEGPSDGEVVLKKETPKASKRTTTRSRKKATSDSDENEASASSDVDIVASASTDDIKKTTRRPQPKATTTAASPKEDQSEKKVRRTTKKKPDSLEAQGSESDLKEFTSITNVVDESEDELELPKDDEEAVSSHGWRPPLVCCFGCAQYLFIPSGRPADSFYHKGGTTFRRKKFVRAPGGSAASVAVILASLGGYVAFMGKVGNDFYGNNLLNYMHNNNVQIRQSVCLDTEKSTAVTQMKISRSGHMRVTTAKSCAEDSLLKSEINIDVLKEAKILYVNTHSLLDENMRSTTLQAIKIAKKFGGLIFYDVNLPLPLWHSNKETKMFIQQVWNLADIIEVTNQELEFLRGIKPSKKLNDDTKEHFKFDFTRYDWEVIEPLWHENLKVLFVTNGAAMIQYFTSEHNGGISGSDAPITPVTGGLSSTGDAIAAALIGRFSFQPTDQITDKEFLERAVRFAINKALIEQWKTRYRDCRELLSAKSYEAGMFSKKCPPLRKEEEEEE